MPKSTPRSPHSPFQHPLFPPTVAEIIETSPGVRLNGNVETAWKLVADLNYHSGGEILVLALAVGCLCRALAERTGNDLDESGRNGPGWVS